MKKTFAIIASVSLALATCSCIIEKRHSADGTLAPGLAGNSFKVEEFDKLDLSGSGTIIYTQAPADSILIEGKPEDIKLLELTQEGSTVHIGWKDRNVKRFRNGAHGRINIYVSSLNLTDVHLSGSSDFHAKKLIKVDDLRISSSGASDIKIDRIEGNSIKVGTSGAGDIEIDSAAINTFFARTSGAGDIEASLYNTDEVDIHVSGAGDVNLDVNNCGDINLDISGAASIDLKGTARSLTKNKSGMASINTDNLTISQK